MEVVVETEFSATEEVLQLLKVEKTIKRRD
jgi:hypothetical protein